MAGASTAVSAEACPNQAVREEQGTTGLSDCRSYELVSPAAKNGGDVMADAGRTRAADSGDAVGFSSLTAFGDVLGTGVGTDYISQRTGQPGTQGWQTHAITPAVDPLSAIGAFHGKDTIYRGEYSSDLSKGVLRSYGPVTGEDPNVANVSHLYLRTDLLAPGAGSYTLLSACPACTSPFNDPQAVFEAALADATPDLGHVIFEANQALSADAPPEPAGCLLDSSCTPNLYEWDHGTLRLAGVLPNGSPAPSSIAGGSALSGSYTLNTISDDGSKIFFTVPSINASGDLYMRVDHTTTVQLNASERTDCADQNPCSGIPEPDPNGPQPATYEIASADGSKVFFTSPEQLTDTLGGDLYVYDTTLPVSDPNHLRHAYADEQPANGNPTSFGVIGISSDGSYVYFLASGPILANQQLPPGGLPIYVWHNGAIAFIGSTAAADITTVNGYIPSLKVRVTADGRTLLFSALDGRDLTGYDHGNTCFGSSATGHGPCSELYRYRADTASLTCVSCNPTGATATADALFTVRAGTGGASSSAHLNHAMSADGDHVFFDTGERLLPDQDTNGKKTDVYEWTAKDASGCTSTSPTYSTASNGCLSLLTTGTSPDDSHFLEASPSGRDVFFSTNQRLNRWDTDNSYDLYDARVEGGFPEPIAPKAECSGETCQGAIPTPPAIGVPSSNTFFGGSDNVVPSVRKVVVKPLTKAQKLSKALRKCKTKRKKVQRKKCEASARKSFGRTK
jgi:hypothetical protein